MNPEWPMPEETDAFIEFCDEDAGFLPSHEEALHSWIRQVIAQEQCELQQLTYIFCSDEYLLQLNIEHLGHDTYTDIITFPYAAPPTIYSDIFISIERVRENAAERNLPFEEELHRVMIHGPLHLCGYPDKTEAEAKVMRGKEDEALALLKL
jgi:probable rRNA maturation factor